MTDAIETAGQFADRWMRASSPFLNEVRERDAAIRADERAKALRQAERECQDEAAHHGPEHRWFASLVAARIRALPGFPVDESKGGGDG